MWEEILNLAIGTGLWAVLFVVLLCYVLKDSRSREKKYQDLIDALSDSLNIVKEVQDDVREIKMQLASGNKEKKAKNKIEQV